MNLLKVSKLNEKKVSLDFMFKIYILLKVIGI